MTDIATAPAVADGTWRQVASLLRFVEALHAQAREGVEGASAGTQSLVSQAADEMHDAAQWLAEAVGQKANL